MSILSPELQEEIMRLEKRGLAASNEGRYAEAVESFERVVAIYPEYEHGLAYYNLACALENIGELVAAEKAYRCAEAIAPDDEIILGGLASFLYLHGSTAEAIESYRKLRHVAEGFGLSDTVSDCDIALTALEARES